MRYPARVVSVMPIGLSLTLDLTGVAPGRSPALTALLLFGRSVGTLWASGLAVGDRIEVVLIELPHLDLLLASLPANPAWLVWNNGTVRQLARRIRETGETVLMPILADALEDAGCSEACLLDHLRSEPPEERSWLVGLLALQE
jgi:hypothetical protein